MHSSLAIKIYKMQQGPVTPSLLLVEWNPSSAQYSPGGRAVWNGLLLYANWRAVQSVALVESHYLHLKVCVWNMPAPATSTAAQGKWALTILTDLFVLVAQQMLWTRKCLFFAPMVCKPLIHVCTLPPLRHNRFKELARWAKLLALLLIKHYRMKISNSHSKQFFNFLPCRNLRLFLMLWN